MKLFTGEGSNPSPEPVRPKNSARSKARIGLMEYRYPALVRRFTTCRREPFTPFGAVSFFSFRPKLVWFRTPLRPLSAHHCRYRSNSFWAALSSMPSG